jgi:hypothetical protein
VQRHDVTETISVTQLEGATVPENENPTTTDYYIDCSGLQRSERADAAISAGIVCKLLKPMRIGPSATTIYGFVRTGWPLQ